MTGVLGFLKRKEMKIERRIERE